LIKNSQFIGTFSGDVFVTQDGKSLVFVVSDSKSLKPTGAGMLPTGYNLAPTGADMLTYWRRCATYWLEPRNEAWALVRQLSVRHFMK
jgi:hypothetical protein